MIDRNAKWNGETLYLWNGWYSLFVISEGTGDNLLKEDVDEGYVDYWMTDWFRADDEGEIEADGGQWMERELVRNKYHTVGEVLERLMECDLWNDNWRLLDEAKGDELYALFDAWCASTAKAKTDGRRVFEFIKRLR